MKNPIYITTSIAYANSKPHIGFAMELVEADAFNRYFSMMGYETYFLTGTDEHGIKQQKTAEELGIHPKELSDKNAQLFMELKDKLNLSYDNFIRTSDKEKHWPSVVQIWNKIKENGDIYKDKYEALYCNGCESFITEKELVDGKCPIHKKEPDKVSEENYFFRLSKYGKIIKKLIESKEIEIVPEFRAKEILNLIDKGLHDISFSRSKKTLYWGIPVPDDDTQVMYVWCDALTNYISGLGYAKNDEQYKKFWPNVIHVIGKDIVRFHTAIWPAMLLSAGVPVPKKIFVHGFITSEGHKMSKSLGNIIDPNDIIKIYGVDALRYYLLSEIPVGQDGDFSKKLFQERYISDLVNNLGNLLNRVLLMTKKYFGGSIPSIKTDVLEEYNKTWVSYIENMNNLYLNKASLVVFSFIDFLNKFIGDTKPWELSKKGDTESLSRVLKILLESLRHITRMIYPFIPETSLNMRKQLGLEEGIDLKYIGWEEVLNWEKIGEIKILFPRI